MTHPTDDELEAMATKLDGKTHNMIEGHVQMEDAAAMLRACKGRVKALVALLREAREDISVYVDTDYPEISRAEYPDIQRRWHRDMEMCRRIDAALRDMGVK